MAVLGLLGRCAGATVSCLETLMELFSSLMALTVRWGKTETIPYNCISFSSSIVFFPSTSVSGPPVAAGCIRI